MVKCILTRFALNRLKVIGAYRRPNGLLVMGSIGETYYLVLKVGSGPYKAKEFDSEYDAYVEFVATSRKYISSPLGTRPDIFDNIETVGDARRDFETDLNEDGKAVCKICKHISRIYKHSLPRSGLMTLAYMVHKNVKLRDGKYDDRFPIHAMHVSEFPKKMVLSRSYNKLIHWDLLISASNPDPAKKDSGFWKPTLLGINFVLGHVPVRKQVILFRNKRKEFAGDLVYFNEVVEGFDFQKLMNDLGGNKEPITVLDGD